MQSAPSIVTSWCGESNDTIASAARAPSPPPPPPPNEPPPGMMTGEMVPVQRKISLPPPPPPPQPVGAAITPRHMNIESLRSAANPPSEFSLQSPAPSLVSVRSKELSAGKSTESPAQRTGKLRVVLQRAYALLAKDKNGLSDPYVIVECGGQKRTSRVAFGTLDPVWNEAFEFSGCLEGFLASGLSLRLFDKDKFSFDDPLGSIHVSLEALENKDHKSFVQALATSGTVYFKAEW